MEPKKYEHQRVERKIPLFFAFGLNVALLLTIVAFEWKVNPERPPIDPPYTPIDLEPLDKVPVTTINIPPPPTPINPEFIPTKEEVIEVTRQELPDEPLVDTPIQSDLEDMFNSLGDIPEAPPTDEPFIIVEEQPSFPGGWEAFYKFLNKNIKYPNRARNMGIEGRVFLKFVIERDGSISDIHVVKGMGAGLDEEALRVLNLLPKFNPGKQRGVPVRVYQSININFQLN